MALGTRMLAPVLFPRMRTRTARSIQTPVQKMALFLASSSQNSDLEPKKTDKDERKEQFEDIENPSAEEILKRIKECCGEAVGKAFEGTNVAFIFSAGNGPEMLQIFQVSLFLSFLLLFGVLLLNNNNLWYFALAKT